MNEKFRPMLASNAVIEKLTYPLLVSAKFDGIRTLIIDGNPVTRNLKDISNIFIRNVLSRTFKNVPGILDGELVCGNFQETSSAVMRFDGEPNFKYCVFDYVKDDAKRPFIERIKEMHTLLMKIESTYVMIVKSEIVNDYTTLLKFEELYLLQGYEGLMSRTFQSPYKFGRSTVNEGYLLKLKRFTDAEAIIIGFEELLHNANDKSTDLLGYSERSSCKDGMIGMNILGSIQVRDLKSGVEFSIGSGFTAEQRREIWDNQSSYIEEIVTYKSQLSGVKDLPRFPVFKGFRSEDDL